MSTRNSLRLGLIGHPVSHSRSPAIFKKLALLSKRPVVYTLYDITPRRLGREFHRLRLLGVNVTIPHKTAVIRLLSRLTPEAKGCGAVNCVRFSRGEAIGHNSDAAGFLDALKALGFRPRGARVLVCGAGGGARAAGWALGRAGAAEVSFFARRPAAARALARALGRLFPRTRFSAGLLVAPALVVNATPLGMKGFPNRSPLKSWPGARFALDLVYGRKTPFVRQARRAGAKAADGVAMLVSQARRSWEFWTGRRAPPAKLLN